MNVTYLAHAVVDLLTDFQDRLHTQRLVLELAQGGHDLALHEFATGTRAEPATVGRGTHLRTKVYTRIHYF